MSEKLGMDMAYAYVDYRVQQMMIDKLVKDRMPKSSVGTLFGKQEKAVYSAYQPFCQGQHSTIILLNVVKRPITQVFLKKERQRSAPLVLMHYPPGGVGSWAA